MRDVGALLEQLVAAEESCRHAVEDEWHDTAWTDCLPSPELQRSYQKLLCSLKEEYAQKQIAKELDTIHAFASLGGHADCKGEVKSELLRRNVKDFGLTIDIDRLIEEADADGSGLLDYEEFRDMFATDSDNDASDGVNNGATRIFPEDKVNPHNLPLFLGFQMNHLRAAGHTGSANVERRVEPRKKPAPSSRTPFSVPVSGAAHTDVSASASATKCGISLDAAQHVPQWCYEAPQPTLRAVSLPRRRCTPTAVATGTPLLTRKVIQGRQGSRKRKTQHKKGRVAAMVPSKTPALSPVTGSGSMIRQDTAYNRGYPTAVVEDPLPRPAPRCYTQASTWVTPGVRCGGAIRPQTTGGLGALRRTPDSLGGMRPQTTGSLAGMSRFRSGVVVPSCRRELVLESCKQAARLAAPLSGLSAFPVLRPFCPPLRSLPT